MSWLGVESLDNVRWIAERDNVRWIAESDSVRWIPEGLDQVRYEKGEAKFGEGRPVDRWRAGGELEERWGRVGGDLEERWGRVGGDLEES